MCAGIGVHTGAHARIVLSPAPTDTGIVFVRSDLRDVDNRIRAHADRVAHTQLGTSLRNDAGAEIATIEHLMAACAGLGVDNLLVEVDGPEVPILDGSSAPFVQVLLNAGLRQQGGAQRVIRLLEPVEIVSGTKRAALLPAPERDNLELDVTIRFADPAIGLQRRVATLTPESFLADIAGARTFGFMADMAALHAMGRGRGARLRTRWRSRRAGWSIPKGCVLKMSSSGTSCWTRWGTWRSPARRSQGGSWLISPDTR
jgi:UDP-3-O-[3-hydroxymyristoyl] N-acetylglucosamine deacetylase